MAARVFSHSLQLIENGGFFGCGHMQQKNSTEHPFPIASDRHNPVQYG
jgi:hypothetical protein